VGRTAKANIVRGREKPAPKKILRKIAPEEDPGQKRWREEPIREAERRILYRDT
jgi:hypothetical protein